MKFERILISLVLMMALIASCKKDDDSVTPSLQGNLHYNIPAYVLPGEVLTLIPTGGIHPEDGDFGYYWRGEGLISGRDTTRRIGDPASKDGRLVITMPDSLFTTSLVCVMYATGYQSLSTTNTVTIVKDGSLTGIPHVDGEKSFVDTRDDRTYSYVSAEGLDWMNVNLKYAAAGKPFEDCAPMTGLFGNLYTYEQAENACPEGWRLPTLDEWKSLCGGSFKGAAGSLMVDSYFNTYKMWEYWPDVKISNKTGMNAIPAGYAKVSEDEWSFGGNNRYAFFWTSSDYDSEQKSYVQIYVDQPDVLVGNAHKDNLAVSVRCVRNSE